MKGFLLHITILSVLAFGLARGQGLNSAGTIENNGGIIKLYSGQVVLNQDTLMGRFELLQKYYPTFYMVPNIVYFQLVVRNYSRRVVEDAKDAFGNTKNLVVMDSLILGDSAIFTTNYIGIAPEDILALASVTNNISQFTGPKYLVMRNDVNQQDLMADGKFSRLNIDNPFGVNVKSGGFEITEKLALTRGELRNSPPANFTMKDSTEIERHVGSSLTTEPNFEKNVNLTYLGIGSMTTTGETPTNPTVLKNMRVLNSDSLILSRNVQVNDTLTVGGRIFALKDTLTLANARNPEFLNPAISEIGGTFRRTQLNNGEKILFHNLNTYFLFPDDASRNGISSIVLDIRPTTFPQFDIIKEKIYRSIEFSAFNYTGNSIQNGFIAEFGVGWRNAPAEQIDEMNNLQASFADLILQRWDGSGWEDLGSTPPQTDVPNKWSHLNIKELSRIGSFAVGLPSLNLISIQMKVILEGAYIEASKGLMATDLWNGMQGNLLVGNINPAQFPFSEMIGYDFTKIISVPDSVVDWIVVQFRNVDNPDIKFTKLLLVKYDGKLLDINGNSRIRINNSEYTPGSNSNLYEAIILHRNHASIKSLNPIELRKDNNNLVYDFTQPDFVFGGTASLKLVDITDGVRIFGMRAGYLINDDATKTEMLNVTSPFTILKDYIIPWNKLPETGYLLYDYDMDGIVTTSDYNYSWNNRSAK